MSRVKDEGERGHTYDGSSRHYSPDRKRERERERERERTRKRTRERERESKQSIAQELLRHQRKRKFSCILPKETTTEYNSQQNSLTVVEFIVLRTHGKDCIIEDTRSNQVTHDL